MSTLSGYRERPHTADWSLDVWAGDLPTLFEEAARGMAELMDLRLEPGPRVQRILQISWSDAEGSLVGFLAELLYLGESEGLGFDRVQVRIDERFVTADLEGAPIAAQAKEIKAVTYHNLAIRRVEDRLETTIVFDV